MKKALSLLPIVAFALAPQAAEAFCGFYVGGAGAKLFNNATQVVMMRSGTRTVLSMQNNYQGPPQDFAMVVPVPQVLQEENVKTLPASVFERVDRLGAPRLVEYWEQDPCYRPRPRPKYKKSMARRSGMAMPSAAPKMEQKVKIEAQFVVGEYDIVILSATDSAALDVWLRQNKYNIPVGAEKVLRPYVAGDMKFFVAKVNIKKVKLDASGRTMLSPLRFHYDTDNFSLPIRLGLLNSQGEQDLIVNILAENQRYQAANYKNVFIPSNLRVRRRTKSEFGPFYASLFDSTMRRNPGSIVTEYSWQASSCDPCPGGSSGLSFGDLNLLGADVVHGGGGMNIATGGPPPPPGKRRRSRRPPPRFRGGAGWTLTRLHTRYTKSNLGQDLVFEAAPPVVGGRGSYQGRSLPHGTQPSSMNAFQGRYYILNRWRGPVSCQNPRYGRWGGPPNHVQASGSAQPATGTAFVKKRRLNMRRYFAQSVPELRFRYSRKLEQ